MFIWPRWRCPKLDFIKSSQSGCETWMMMSVLSCRTKPGTWGPKGWSFFNGLESITTKPTLSLRSRASNSFIRWILSSFSFIWELSEFSSEWILWFQIAFSQQTGKSWYTIDNFFIKGEMRYAETGEVAWLFKRETWTRLSRLEHTRWNSDSSEYSVVPRVEARQAWHICPGEISWGMPLRNHGRRRAGWSRSLSHQAFALSMLWHLKCVGGSIF